jgi:hypothetical protein
MKKLLLLLVLTSAACAQNEAAIAKAKAGCGPDNVKFDVSEEDTDGTITAPDQGKALIYVVGQESDCKDSCGFLARIGMDGKWVGALKGNSHFSFAAEPGEQHLCANWQSRLASVNRMVSLAKINVEPGKIYYFRVRIVLYAGLDLDLIDSDEGRYLVAISQDAIFTAKK